MVYNPCRTDADRTPSVTACRAQGSRVFNTSTEEIIYTRGTTERRGAQIDLVIQRADGFTDLCEMKHSDNVFTIDNDYAKDLQNKQSTYQELSKDRRTLHLVMVTTNGVTHNSNYNIIQNELTIEDLFAI